MCGIAGIFNMKNAKNVTFSEENKAFLMKFLLSELTKETESRGKDATGYFTLFQNGENIGLKHGIKATEFCTKSWNKDEYTFKNHLDLIETYHTEVSPIASAISHCRAKTHGGADDNKNNHPIYVENLVGIHNGVLNNDDKIYENIKDEITRIGEVDSEMIVQSLWLATKKGEEKFNESMIKEVSEKLGGSFAFICLDKNDPNSVFFLRDTRPIEMIYLVEAGLLVVVSERRFLTKALELYNTFKFYGLDAPPELTKINYDLPDDTGFILRLDTVISAEMKIKDMFSEIKIEKTGEIWKTYSPNTPNNSYGTYTSNDNDYCCGYNNYNKCSNPPAAYIPPRQQEFKINKKTNNIVLKKVEHEESENVVKMAVWDTATKEFTKIEKNKNEVYTDTKPTVQYEIFRSSKILSGRLGIEENNLDSLTSAQLANKVSKYIQETQITKIKKETTTAKERVTTLEEKANKARKHIINLRNIVNIFAKMLGKNTQIENKFNTNETKALESSWDLLYRKRRIELQGTVLGKFICGLKEKVVK